MTTGRFALMVLDAVLIVLVALQLPAIRRAQGAREPQEKGSDWKPLWLSTRGRSHDA